MSEGFTARALALTAAAVLAVSCAPAAAPTPPAPASQAKVASGTGAAAWVHLKRALPGAWTMPGKSGPFTVTFKLISGESALAETWGAGGGHETMTIFHPDHEDLVLTHYCAQGNQPRLRVISDSADTVAFRFADATNLQPDQAVLVERTLHFTPDAFDDTEVYKQPDGRPESTTYHFTRAAPASSAK